MKTSFRNGLLMMLLLIATTSCGLSSDEEQAVYRYTIRAYYLDGGNKVITMDGYEPPNVCSPRGSYWLETFYQRYGCERTIEPAACRYDILKTEDITEKCFNKTIISSRNRGGIIIHKLSNKAETK